MFRLLIAVALPSLSFFLMGKFFKGFLCIPLQLSGVGWIAAAIWAVVEYLVNKQKERPVDVPPNKCQVDISTPLAVESKPPPHLEEITFESDKILSQLVDTEFKVLDTAVFFNTAVTKSNVDDLAACFHKNRHDNGDLSINTAPIIDTQLNFDPFILSKSLIQLNVKKIEEVTIASNSEIVTEINELTQIEEAKSTVNTQSNKDQDSCHELPKKEIEYNIQLDKYLDRESKWLNGRDDICMFYGSGVKWPVKKFLKKEAGAIKGYAYWGRDDAEEHMRSNCNPVLIIDFSIFGSADNGLYLTHDSLFIKVLMEDRYCVKYSDIKSIRVDSDDKEIMINGKYFGYTHSEMTSRMKFIVQCIKDYKIQAPI